MGCRRFITRLWYEQQNNIFHGCSPSKAHCVSTSVRKAWSAPSDLGGQVIHLNSLFQFQQHAAFWSKSSLFFLSSAFALFWHWWRGKTRGREGQRSDTNNPVVPCTWERSGVHFPVVMTSEQIKLEIYYCIKCSAVKKKKKKIFL